MDWDDVKYLWENDSVWREQILLAAIVGAIGFAWVVMEVFVKRAANV